MSSEQLPTHRMVVRRGYISCYCRAVFGKHAPNPVDEFYEPMDLQRGESFFQTYNRPENHYAPFDDKDKLKI